MAKGNPGVAGIVQQTEGAIGSINGVRATNLKTAKLKNRTAVRRSYAGDHLRRANVDLPDDMRATITPPISTRTP